MEPREAQLLAAAAELEKFLEASGDDAEEMAQAFAALGQLRGEQQHEAVARVSEVNMQALELLKKTLHATRQMLHPHHTAKALPVLSVKDVETDPKLELAKQFREMSLWVDTLRVNSKVFAAIDALAHKEEKETVATTGGEDFRAAYMEAMTDGFADELDSLRKESSFDASRVSVLVDALELGMNIWPTAAGTGERRLWLPSGGRQGSAAPVHSAVSMQY